MQKGAQVLHPTFVVDFLSKHKKKKKEIKKNVNIRCLSSLFISFNVFINNKSDILLQQQGTEGGILQLLWSKFSIAENTQLKRSKGVGFERGGYEDKRMFSVINVINSNTII